MENNALNTDLDLEITRELNSPLYAVWEAWSNPLCLIEWWCPKPWLTKVVNFDFRSGGAFEVIMQGPDGEENAVNGIFLEVLPQQRIVFTSALSAGWRPSHDPFLDITAVIELEDKEESTLYKATVLHENTETCQKHKDMGFYQGWRICIDQLESLAQTIK